MNRILFCFGGVRVALECELPLSVPGRYREFLSESRDDHDVLIRVDFSDDLPALQETFGDAASACTYYPTVNDPHDFNALSIRTPYGRRLILKNECRARFTPVMALRALDIPELLLDFGGLILHASYIDVQGQALLFTAPSGTGKSTQADLWNRFRGAEILNGDRVLLRKTDGVLMAHGIFYAGTSTISRNRSLPIKAILSIYQNPENVLHRARGVEALHLLRASCSFDPADLPQSRKVSELLMDLVETVPVWRFGCLPDESAVTEVEQTLWKTS